MELNSETFEYEQCTVASDFVQGKLKANANFWRDIGASQFVQEIIQHGYTIAFNQSPLSYSIENRNSALIHRNFVNEAISELLARVCIKEVPLYPEFCNPLHIAIQSSGKLRLILDLSHLNSFIVRKSIKYEDLRTVLQIFSPGAYVFSFDLKSAYHHMDICEEQTKYLTFKWSFDGVMKFYVFRVLPFGLTTAPYVISKVMRQLVKLWRTQGFSIPLYLDDGIGGDQSFERADFLSHEVRRDIILPQDLKLMMRSQIGVLLNL